MAQGENAEKRSKTDKEWWGKRPLSGIGVSKKSGTMKYFKRLLHKIERRMNKEQTLKEINK